MTRQNACYIRRKLCFPFYVSPSDVREKTSKKLFSKKYKKGIDKSKMFCYNSDCSARWCGSMAEQLICNQQVDGSTPFTSSSIYGGIPERPKGADCKSVVTDFAGPNPASPTITKNRPLWSVFLLWRAKHGFGPGTPRRKAQVLLVRIPRAERVELARKRQA